MLPGKGHHFIGARRGAADAQASVALRDEPTRDGMEDLVEHGMAKKGLRIGEPT